MCVPFCGGSWVPIERKVAWDEAYLHTKWHLSPAVWPQRTLPKIWGCAPLGEGELGPHLTQCRVGRGLPTSVPSDILIHPAVWPQ